MQKGRRYFCKKFIILIKIGISLHFFFFINPAYAQDYKMVRTFTMADGLPSNHIYDLVEDKDGFLWLATDNGVSRFDGKYFKNFTVKDGLPSYDAIQIEKDGQGVIWVNCYQQNPVYFDKLNNKFIKIPEYTTDKDMRKSLVFMFNTYKGLIDFQNYSAKWTFSNQKLVQKTEPNRIRSSAGKMVPFQFKLNYNSQKLPNQSILTLTKEDNNKYFVYINAKKLDTKTQVCDGQIYIAAQNKLYRFSDFSERTLHFKQEEVPFQEAITELKILENELHLKSDSGSFYILDRQTLQVKFKIFSKNKATNLIIDSQKNLWMGTFETGLELYSQNTIKNLEFNRLNIIPNFLSIAADEKGQVYAGNFYGQILRVKAPKVYNLSDGERTRWIRKIAFSKDKILAFGESFIFDDLKNHNATSPYLLNGLKSAAKHNDSLMLFGTLSGLSKYEVLNKKITKLNSPIVRIHKIVKASDRLYYYIGQNRLYQYDMIKNESKEVFSVKPLSEISFQNLAFAKDSTLWASSEIGDMYVFKNKQLILKIDKTQIPENISTLFSHKNQIWVGSKAGISIIQYSLKPTPTYKISNISKFDGLQANTINDLCANQDTVYAATEKGIAVIPDNIAVNSFEIRPIITKIRIFEKDTTLLEAYKLKTNENFVSIDLAGVDLSGHFKALQYALNEPEKWYDLSSNSLNLRLTEGFQKVYFRAVNHNNQAGNLIKEVAFDVKIPFYKTLEFYISYFIFAIALIGFIIYSNSLRKQKRQLDKQKLLEDQRLKITADLHDDIGSTLSSLQINSLIANHLMENKPTKAKEVLEKIEEQSRELSERIGDIIWSMKPGKDEFIDFETRIKTFINHLLGSTNTEVKIDIDPSINSVLNEISLRKNLIFIAKEAINNAAKYSKAGHLSISAKIHNKEIILKIMDDGIGFEVGKTTGNGLKNIEYRVKELKGKFSLTSSASAGCLIEVAIPCP